MYASVSAIHSCYFCYMYMSYPGYVMKLNQVHTVSYTNKHHYTSCVSYAYTCTNLMSNSTVIHSFLQAPDLRKGNDANKRRSSFTLS